ncbi:MAG: Gfo/Idh/MocA family protein [Paracoccaceae bacterium]
MMQVALVGLGMVSGTFVSALRDLPDLRLTRVHARSADSRARFLAAHPDLGAVDTPDLATIAHDPAIDFVILATPPDARADAVATLAAAGKPILMEKPVERDLARATTLVAQCEAASVPLGIVLQHRARPIVAQLRAMLPDLGPLRLIEIAIPWWRDPSYYDTPGRGTYARDGGGVLLTQAVHTLDLALSLAEPVAGPVTQVTAMTATTGFHRMEAEDIATAGLRFANGAVGTLMASTASFPGRGETITLHGAAGSAHLEAGTLRIDWQTGHTETRGQTAQSGAGADPMGFTSDWHRSMITDFATSLTERRPPMVTGRDALRVHRLIDALERSAHAGATIPL